MPIAGAVLDHVAVAVESWAEAWPRYVVALGGEWASGGTGAGFAPSQLRFANGARLEVLQPWETDSNPFLRRFLDSNGPGPHHLTFKVPDLELALAAARGAGFDPVNVDRSDPGWLEAFLHPRQALGVVIQLAQAAGTWQSPAPEGFPRAGHVAPATLEHVTHAVADIGTGTALYAGLLGGQEVARHDDPDGNWASVTLAWDGPLRVRLVGPGPRAHPGGPVGTWLGGRAGRIHHLAFAQPGGAPALRGDGTPGVEEAEHPAELVEPGENLGTRLVVKRGARA